MTHGSLAWSLNEEALCGITCWSCGCAQGEEGYKERMEENAAHNGTAQVESALKLGQTYYLYW